jgi:hypothetical protein
LGSMKLLTPAASCGQAFADGSFIYPFTSVNTQKNSR